MIEKWTGRLVGKMHNNSISNADVANELGVTPAYVSMILNGTRKPADAKSKMEAAVDAIIERRSK